MASSSQLLRLSICWLAILASLFLSGCNTNYVAGIKTLRSEFLVDPTEARRAEIDPGHLYMLVESNGKEALLAWVGEEPHSLGIARIWASTDGVIVRTVNGLLVGISEPKRSWLLNAQHHESANWKNPGKNSLLIQTTDLQPGYRINHNAIVEQRPVSYNTNLTWASKGDLLWIEEVEVSTGLRLAVYGKGINNQIYAGERCMTDQWCLRWQTWPPRASTSSL